MAFELLLGELDRPCSRKLFFTFLEVSHQGERGSRMRQFEHLSLKAQSGYKIFGPFADSMKPWKHIYPWVSPVSSSVIDQVVELNEKGDVNLSRILSSISSG